MSTEIATFAPKTYDELKSFAKAIYPTQFAGNFKGDINSVFVAIQYGAELGIKPMASLQNIAVINGKPSVYGDMLLALVRNSPLCEDIIERIEGTGENTKAICIAKRKGSSEVVSEFSVEDAKFAGLWGRKGPWTQYPKRMLKMRARGFALRDAFPDLLSGVITREEAMDYPTDNDIVDVPEEHIEELVQQEEQQSDKEQERQEFNVEENVEKIIGMIGASKDAEKLTKNMNDPRVLSVMKTIKQFAPTENDKIIKYYNDRKKQLEGGE